MTRLITKIIFSAQLNFKNRQIISETYCTLYLLILEMNRKSHILLICGKIIKKENKNHLKPGKY